MLAYAMAGSMQERIGADTTKFVQVPLDVGMKYYFRAKRSASAIPFSGRLQWLQARDVDERSEWVSRFRDRIPRHDHQ